MTRRGPTTTMALGMLQRTGELQFGAATAAGPVLEWSILGRVWVALRRRWLDYVLARGGDPSASRILALRAHQLTSRRTRMSLGEAIDRILTCAYRPRRWQLTIQPDRACVDAARADLEAIAQMLRGSAPVYVRGVAITRVLIRDADSPLFDCGEAETAWYWAQLATRALGGHL